MNEPLRVLLVEDSPTDAKLVLHALHALHRSIEHERVDGAGALREALRSKTWDIVLSDWGMPNFDALAALAVLRESNLDLPFIIVSGTIGEETAVEAMRAGAHDYVLKDNLARLAPAVEREIRESEMRAARRQTDARYRRIIETTNEGVWIIDAEGRTKFMNARMAQMLGIGSQDVVGLSPREFIDEDEASTMAKNIGALRTGKHVQREVRYRRRDGTSFWSLIDASPMFDAGTYEGAIAMVTDITERKQAEEALRSSEARFRCLWDSGILLITISDETGTIRDINEAGARMLGYERHELLSSSWRGMTPAEWIPANARALEQLQQSKSAPPWEQELLRKDGSRVSVLAAATAHNGERIGIAIDFTEKKNAETALLERMKIAALSADVGAALTHGLSLKDMLQRCAQAIVDHLDAAFARVWTLDARKTLLELQASAGMYTHLDGSHGKVPVGKLKIGLIAEERQPHLTNNVLDDPRIGDPAWARREGMVAFAGHPLLVGDDVVGVVAMFARRPLTETTLKGLGAIADSIAVGVQAMLGKHSRESLEAQLRQAQKMEAVGRLAGGVAHDFNNLLSVVLTYCELLIADMKSGDPMRVDIEEIQKAGLRAAALTRQLLMFSRQQVLEPRTLDLNELLVQMDNMLQRIIGEDIELVSIPSPTLGMLRADPGSIEQVVMNLVVNARDAMPTGGKITIETGNVILDDDWAQQHVGVKAGRYVLLAVTDSGVGMDAATQARIFEPFFTTKDKSKGTGLGLSTVFGIVQQSGGTVWVYSEPGKGTTFKIFLPRVDERPETSRAPAAASTLRGTETILLVEDEDQVRNVAMGILRRSGYQVLEARSAADALLICERHDQIHLLLTDVVMPHMSGPALAKRLRQSRPEIRVLCMSGYTDDSIVRHGILQAEIAYLQKPITPTALLQKVRDVLEA
jgi:PAS domain S-box-containing protein